MNEVQRVKFKVVRGRSWNGNGFGTDPAHWDATLDGEVIAKWRNDSSGNTHGSEIFGERTTLAFTHTYREWRTAVLKAVAERERQQASTEDSDALLARIGASEVLRARLKGVATREGSSIERVIIDALEDHADVSEAIQRTVDERKRDQK